MTAAPTLPALIDEVEKALDLTPDQKSLARHALGLPNKRRQSYRNYFVTGSGCVDFSHWLAMVAMGAARRHAPSAPTGGDDCFTLTRSGAEAALNRGEKLDAEDFPPTKALAALCAAAKESEKS